MDRSTNDDLDPTTRAVRHQLAAMGAAVFEVGLLRPAGPNDPDPSMLLRSWDSETLRRSIPWLRYQNASGRHIYVRPRGEHDLSMVDDLTAESVKSMKASGFQPAAVVETSPGNFQVWLKHPEVLPAAVSTLAARRLAADFGGDRGAADWRHFGRLAGFVNRKPKYEGANGLFPFVRLIEATGERYAAGMDFIAKVKAEYAASLCRPSVPAAPCFSGRSKTSSRTIEQFRADPKYGGDNTRIDLAYALYALSHGLPEAAVAAAIRGRDLSHKGCEKRQEQYVQRTLAKALGKVRAM